MTLYHNRGTEDFAVLAVYLISVLDITKCTKYLSCTNTNTGRLEVEGPLMVFFYQKGQCLSVQPRPPQFIVFFLRFFTPGVIWHLAI